MKTVATLVDRHAARGWEAGLRCQPDCRHHLNEPYRSVYGAEYDRAVAYRESEGIVFWTAKAAIAVRLWRNQ
jgi:hypothetical protein